MIKNDIGDAVTFYMLRNDLILNPVGGFAATSKYLTPAAVAALDTACAGLVAEGEPLPTSSDTTCADTILAVYYDEAIGGVGAYQNWNRRTMEPGYAWTVQLQAGYRPEQIRGIADDTLAEYIGADCYTSALVGSRSMNGYLRVYEQIRDLIGTLQGNGFDVWVLSASSQHIVEAFAEHVVYGVGIAADHVVGVRAVVGDDGLLTADFQGCGNVADGANSLITYVDGKRCWVNQEIFGLVGDEAMGTQTDVAQRLVFGAGDSNTDVSFLRDAVGVRLVLNRGKKELMCNAYGNADGTWIVNPMWIRPNAVAPNFLCSATACFDVFGSGIPCVDENGVPIPDQVDDVVWADDVCE